jgi:dCTP deaminase
VSGILTGPEIERQVGLGGIRIWPWDSKLLNPASVDLRLGWRVAKYVKPRRFVDPFGLGAHIGGLDCKNEASLTVEYRDIPNAGAALEPGELYLMHTEERIWTDRFVPVLDGKSSIGRLGICVHLTAGYGDPGFDGQYTLEVTTVYPVKVYAGMRFCQMRFHTMEGESALYAGNYTGEHSTGPVPSRVWKQFQ